MTDKQIIIDGIDISGCEFYWRKKELCTNGNLTCYCQENKDCLYKKYKHKEQECEELKEDRERWKSNFNGKVSAIEELLQQLAQLKAENDGLKTMLKDLSYENQKFCYQIEEQTKQLEPFKDEYFKGLDNVAIAKLAKKSIRITAENSKLEQILIEIKEIAEGMHDLWINKTSYTDMDNLVKHLLECELNRIRYKLDEISECEVENAR